jgi:EmrB/QacA subfamily drug resistance transporter
MPQTNATHSRLLLPVLLTGIFMGILDVFIVNVAAPSIRTDLGATDSDVQWFVGAYVLVFAVTLITGGRVGDVAGRRRTFKAGLALFSAASAACALAPSPAVLIASRAVQGFGAALLWPQVLSVIQVEFAPDQRPSKLAALGGVQGLAATVAQIVGGALIGLDLFGLGWRWVFLVNIPFGVAALLLADQSIPESRSPSARRLDLPGVALATALLLLVVTPLVEGRELGWPVWLLGAAVLAAPLAIAFVALERRIAARGGSPLVEFRLFAERAYRLGSAAMFIVYFIVANFLLIAIYLQDGAGLSAIESGLLFTPLAVAYSSASLLGPRLLARTNGRLPLFGALFAAAGLTASSLVVDGSGGELHILPLAFAFIVFGTGMGLFIPTSINLVLRQVPTDDAGAASGMLSTIQQVGNTVGIATVGTVFFAALGTGTPVDYDHAFAIATGLQVLAALCGAALIWRLLSAAPARTDSPPSPGRSTSVRRDGSRIRRAPERVPMPAPSRSR